MFEWAGFRAEAILQGAPGGPPGTICSMQALSQLTAIFSEISQLAQGRALIHQAGGKELFHALISSLPQSEIQLIGQMEKVMIVLV